MDVVTLGSFILDDIYLYPPVLQPLYAVAGGAGLYAAVAARMFLSGNSSTRIGLILHEGRDFPKPAKNQIEALNMHAKFIERSDSNTTRGSNVYNVYGNRKFAFITPNLKIRASMMDETMLKSKTYHIICTPHRCIDLCKEIFESRKNLERDRRDLGTGISRRPSIIWEPMEDSCRSKERESFLKALEYVDVFSPNHHELLALYDAETTTRPKFDLQTVTLACKKLLEGTKQRAIVARCGPYGCVVVRSNCQHIFVVPAYHESLTESGISKPSGMIVDPTGAGNAFLGGFCAALSSESTVGNFISYEAASLYGNVSASYAIEQFGLPQMSLSEGREMWNGSSPLLRLAQLTHRLEENSRQHYGLQRAY